MSTPENDALTEAEQESLCVCGYGVVCQECMGVYRSERDAARAVVEAATPGLSGFPKDCRNTCYDDACTCSGIWPVLAWAVDMEALRAALGMSTPPGQDGPQ